MPERSCDPTPSCRRLSCKPRSTWKVHYLDRYLRFIVAVIIYMNMYFRAHQFAGQKVAERYPSYFKAGHAVERRGRVTLNKASWNSRSIRLLSGPVRSFGYFARARKGGTDAGRRQISGLLRTDLHCLECTSTAEV